jgi:hypothetical protein
LARVQLILDQLGLTFTETVIISIKVSLLEYAASHEGP